MLQNIKSHYDIERRGGAATNVFCVNKKHHTFYFIYFFLLDQPQAKAGELFQDNYLHR